MEVRSKWRNDNEDISDQDPAEGLLDGFKTWTVKAVIPGGFLLILQPEIWDFFSPVWGNGR